ncbi:MAG TPA: OmpH family outer membrane protein [Thermoguttaceae bacterium]|nr:OmpH family outer membrane protein [Thermoguttaceae bacterium]
MRNSRLLIAIAGSVLIAGLAVFTALAQQGTTRPMAGPQMGAPQVAFVDVGYVFKKHPGFQGRKVGLETEMKRASEGLNQERETIRKMRQDLQGMQAGTEEYKQLDQHSTKRAADLQVQFQLQQKEFATKESNMYYTVYQEIAQEVGYLASQNGFSAVFYVDGDTPDKDRLPQVQAFVNKQIVWFDQRLDVTPEIVSRLERKYGAQPGNPNANPAAQRTRTGVPAPSYR